MPNGALIRHRCNYPLPIVCLAGYSKFVDGKRILGCSAWSVGSLDRRFVTSLLDRVVCRKEKQQKQRVEPPAPPRSRSRCRCRCRSVCAAYCSPPASFGSHNLGCLPRETVNELTEPYRTHERAKPTSPSPSTALAIDRGAHCGRSSVLAETLYCSDVREVDKKKVVKPNQKRSAIKIPENQNQNYLARNRRRERHGTSFSSIHFFLLPNKFLTIFGDKCETCEKNSEKIIIVHINIKNTYIYRYLYLCLYTHICCS